jgi:hypothetical protein
MNSVEKKIKALELFKDWSNALLVTTVAAVGWIIAKDSPRLPSCIYCVTILSFGMSIIFAILTLALIPLVAEELDEYSESIYTTDGNLYVLWFFKIKCRLIYVCWPQHVLFIVGIVFYVFGSLGLTTRG